MADAKDKRGFDKLVQNFVKDSSYSGQLQKQLSSWIVNHTSFENLKKNPKLNRIAPLSKNLAEVSEVLLVLIDTEILKLEQVDELNSAILQLNENDVDVEFVIVDSLEKLATYYREVSLHQIPIEEGE